MKVPPPPEAEALRAAAQAAKTDHAALARQVRRDLPDWVRAMVLDACAELESASQRNAVVGDRTHTAEAIALLRGRRESVVERIVGAMEQQLDGAATTTRAATPATPGRSALTLIDESQIDEDIEIARIVQAVEAEADAEIRQLAALASGLRGLPGIETSAMPLRPLDCATALRGALLELAPDDPTRLFLLRHLGSAMGRELRQVYVRLSDTLLRWGVRPAKYRVRQTPQPAGPARAAAHAQAHAPAHPPTMGGLATLQPTFDRRAAAAGAPGGALQQLVERARRSLAAPDARIDPFAAAGAPPPVGEAEALALRLFADPLPTEQARPALDPVVAVQLMERLFAQIEQHLGHVPATRSLLAGLQEPGRALAAREAQLWNSPEHPWWKFLDRLIAMGSVHDESGAEGNEDDDKGGIVTQSLALVVERMRGAQTLDRDTCQTAADEVEALASRHLGERGEALASQSGALQQQADREQIQIDLRNQLVQQLRSTPVCGGLRRFLVGPWTQAMAAAAARHGLGSPAMDLMALVVDDLIRATAKPGQRVSRAQRNVLLRQVGEGLAEADVPTLRVETEVAELQALLRNPPPPEVIEESPPEEQPWEAPAVRDPEHTTAALDLHAGLPTVPIGFGVDSTLEAEGHKPWLESLRPGDYCRLFLMGRWITAQLSWVSGTHNLFLFSSRHGGRTHSLTKRMLGKLRIAGLATSIQDGALLAQAMQTLAETDFAAG